MKLLKIAVVLFLLAVTLPSGAETGPVPAPAPNGMTLPEDYRDWRIISTSHREDSKTLRVIVGNDLAVRAARSGQTNPWPDGAILGKIVWRDSTLPTWEKATVPGQFVHVEFMIKDSTKYGKTGGWGFARWLGPHLEAYGKDGSFVQECFGCHTPVKNNDYVFTIPPFLP